MRPITDEERKIEEEYQQSQCPKEKCGFSVGDRVKQREGYGRGLYGTVDARMFSLGSEKIWGLTLISVTWDISGPHGEQYNTLVKI